MRGSRFLQLVLHTFSAEPISPMAKDLLAVRNINIDIENPPEAKITVSNEERGLLPGPLHKIVIEECKATKVNFYVIEAIALVESGGTPNLIGDNGESIGLCQIQPKWHKERMKRLGVTDLKDPRQNIKVCVDILNELVGKYDTLEEALTAYNAGYDTGDRTYANKIMEVMDEGKY